MPDELDQFVYRALAKGVPRERIAAALHEAGWPEDAVTKALGAYADVDCPEPVPRPRRHLSAADAILHLGVFSSLYVWVGTWVWLLFVYVGVAYADPLAGPGSVESLRSSLRWAIAALVIAYPLYLWLSGQVRQGLRDNPERRRSRARSWLIWLTLFVTAAALLGDLATLVYRFLDGELSARFLLKAAIVGMISAGLFVHYRAMLQVDGDETLSGLRHRPVRWLGPATAVAMAASLVTAFWLAGTPARARDLAMDDRRMADLRAIAHAVDRYWERHQALPNSLETLAGERRVGPLELRDPATGRRYEYAVTGAQAYRLCAEFAAPSGPEAARFWRHREGRHCYALTSPQ